MPKARSSSAPSPLVVGGQEARQGEGSALPTFVTFDSIIIIIIVIILFGQREALETPASVDGRQEIAGARETKECDRILFFLKRRSWWQNEILPSFRGERRGSANPRPSNSAVWPSRAPNCIRCFRVERRAAFRRHQSLWYSNDSVLLVAGPCRDERLGLNGPLGGGEGHRGASPCREHPLHRLLSRARSGDARQARAASAMPHGEKCAPCLSFSPPKYGISHS